jgi:hypothetical protein
MNEYYYYFCINQSAKNVKNADLSLPSLNLI